MSREKLKVLEMVAEGRITPEEGVRLIEALGEADRASHSGRRLHWPGDIGDIRLPKIDLGQIGEVCVELKKSVVDTARKAHSHLKRSKAGKYLEFKDYPLSIERPTGVERCKLAFDVRAGKLKLKGEEIGDLLLVGKVKRAPEKPVIITDVRDNVSDVTLRHSLGRCLLRANPTIPYSIALSNAAADSRLQLEQLEVTELDIDNNAGGVMVALGEMAGQVGVNISNNAGSVQLKVPGSHAVRVTSTGSLSSTNLEKLGLEPVDGAASSLDWDDNPRRVDIILDQNVANFNLIWKRSDGVWIEGDNIALEPDPIEGLDDDSDADFGDDSDE
jgi:hypothetical protein